MPTEVLFEPLFTEEDAIISDSLTMRASLTACASARQNVCVTRTPTWKTGALVCKKPRIGAIALSQPTVYSLWMERSFDGQDCELAEKYDALVMVDESHSAGVSCKRGRGVAENLIATARLTYSPARSVSRLAVHGWFHHRS